MGEQKLENESAKISISAQIEKLDLKQNINAVAKLFLYGTGGVAGRVLFQHIPSIETITPFAILAGFELGPIFGFIMGASGFYASNYFVWGGQGPWTIFQVIAAGSAGAAAGFFGKISKGLKSLVTAVIAGTIIYEIIVNIGGSLLLLPFTGVAKYLTTALPLYFVTSLPFSIVHFISTLGFALALYGFKDKIPKLGGKIIEKINIIAGRGNSSSGSSGLHPEHYEYAKHTVLGKNYSKLVSRFSWKRASDKQNSQS